MTTATTAYMQTKGVTMHRGGRLLPAFSVLWMACILTACGGYREPLELVVQDKGCWLLGWPGASAADFSLKWVIEDQQHTSYEVSLVRLDEAMTIYNLSNVLHGKSSQELEKIPWAHQIAFDSIAQGGPYSKQVTWDLTADVNLRPGPASVVCIVDDRVLSVLGPVEVLR